MIKNLTEGEIEKFRINYSRLKLFISTPILLTIGFVVFLLFQYTEINFLGWIGIILFGLLCIFIRINLGSYIITEEATFSAKNGGLVLWSHKDQLNFMDKVYNHDDIEEFTIKDGFLKKKVSVLFKDGSKEELSSYFLIFKYQ
jgi:type IV secretory pathway VirB6-like protein